MLQYYTLHCNESQGENTGVKDIAEGGNMTARIRRKTKKKIAQIIRQGYNEDTQELFNIIFEVMTEKFYEDNHATLASFMRENTEHSCQLYNPKKDMKYRMCMNKQELSDSN